jgi:hypothetical protein
MDKRKIFNAFNPNESLPPGDERYVDFSAERGSIQLLKTMADTIRFSDASTCQLLSGHRGCGKTTEFDRLKSDL